MTRRTLNLDKNGHKYVFRYVPGEEDEVITEIMQLADDKRTDLDWLDAARLSFRVAQYTALDCCATAAPVGIPLEFRVDRGAEMNSGSDDAKDDPCANCA